MLTFSKMHGIGNDYIYINCFQETVTDPEKLSIFLSDVRFGIGSDGLVLILPSEVADLRMRIFNADGSEAMMCGNATRCIGKYVYDMGMTDKTEISLENHSGIKYLTLYPGADNKIESVKVDMGKAILVPKDIPVNSDLDRFIAQPVTVDGKEYAMTCVSMGTRMQLFSCRMWILSTWKKSDRLLNIIHFFPGSCQHRICTCNRRIHTLLLTCSGKGQRLGEDICLRKPAPSMLATVVAASSHTSLSARWKKKSMVSSAWRGDAALHLSW